MPYVCRRGPELESQKNKNRNDNLAESQLRSCETENHHLHFIFHRSQGSTLRSTLLGNKVCLVGGDSGRQGHTKQSFIQTAHIKTHPPRFHNMFCKVQSSNLKRFSSSTPKFTTFGCHRKSGPRSVLDPKPSGNACPPHLYTSSADALGRIPQHPNDADVTCVTICDFDPGAGAFLVF